MALFGRDGPIDPIAAEATAYAKKNGNAIAARLTSLDLFPAEEEPASVFMAGSPGAGKTEASKALIAKFERAVVRIDPDDLRAQFAHYNGSNSQLFQSATSLLVEKIHDRVLKQRQTFVLDGTLSHYSVARKNVERSLRKNRLVQILYVYQRPQLAWEFVLARERVEGRHIPPEQFVEQYFAARNVVNRLKAEFHRDVTVDLLVKDTDGGNSMFLANVDNIDRTVPEKHTREDVERIVQLR